MISEQLLYYNNPSYHYFMIQYRYTHINIATRYIAIITVKYRPSVLYSNIVIFVCLSCITHLMP